MFTPMDHALGTQGVQGGGHFLQEGRGIELAEIIAEFMNES